MTHVFQWVLIAIILTGAVNSLQSAERPSRDAPLTSGQYAISAVIQVLLALGVLTLLVPK